MRWCQKLLPNSDGNNIAIDSLPSDDCIKELALLSRCTRWRVKLKFCHHLITLMSYQSQLFIFKTQMKPERFLSYWKSIPQIRWCFETLIKRLQMKSIWIKLFDAILLNKSLSWKTLNLGLYINNDHIHRAHQILKTQAHVMHKNQ